MQYNVLGTVPEHSLMSKIGFLLSLTEVKYQARETLTQAHRQWGRRSQRNPWPDINHKCNLRPLVQPNWFKQCKNNTYVYRVLKTFPKVLSYLFL